MAEHFEARHRELRETVVRYQVAWQQSEIDGSSLIAADNILDHFRDRTSSLVDEAVGAAREMLKFGEHEGPCVLDAHTGKCTAHAKAFEERGKELADRLAALDEEAAR